MHQCRLSIWYVRVLATFLALQKALADIDSSVRNHGIPEDTIDKALSASKEFFSLPLDQKIEVVECVIVEELALTPSTLPTVRHPQSLQLQGVQRHPYKQ